MARGSEHRLMIVEDDQDTRELFAEVLRERGYDVLEAEHGKHALEVLAAGSTPPCAMLVDIMMPVMDGAELVRHLRATPRYASIPVIVLSAIGNQSAVPATGYFFPKPVNITALLDTISELCPT